MRILVTGATGFIGQVLVPLLVSAGESTAVLVRNAYKTDKPLPSALLAVRSRIETCYADLCDARLTTRAVQQVSPDVVFHLAAVGATRPFLKVDLALRTNLIGTLNLLHACFETSHRTQQLLVARTPGELSAMNVYAASKAAAWSFCEMYGRTKGWPIHGAVIFQAYGPGQPGHTLIPAAFRAALAGANFPMTSGAQERDWIHVEDVVRGLHAALGRNSAPGTTFDLGTGRATSLLSVVQQIYDLVDRGGQPCPGALPDRPGEVERQVADAARTEALIGWNATTPLADGLRKLLAHWTVQSR